MPGGFTGFLVSAAPAAARMLSCDPRVSVVEELVSETAAPSASELSHFFVVAVFEKIAAD